MFNRKKVDILEFENSSLKARVDKVMAENARLARTIKDLEEREKASSSDEGVAQKMRSAICAALEKVGNCDPYVSGYMYTGCDSSSIETLVDTYMKFVKFTESRKASKNTNTA